MDPRRRLIVPPRVARLFPLPRPGRLRSAVPMERARYAADPSASRGREFGMPPGSDHQTRGPRTAFQRDRDRIVHSIAFRRLRSKTQVFIAPDGDHYRTRLTHSLEVAQIGRVIARALRLDEDLTEALCLAHDIGHPPFGHPGEEALASAMAGAGGFDHNEHALRVLMRLECPYPTHDGLNLSWETLEGMAKHNGPVASPGWALAELDAVYSLSLGAYPSLEAQVAAVADDIAYDNHDIDDGLRAGFLTLDQLLDLPPLAARWQTIERRFPHAPRDRLLRQLVRDQIGAMVNDVIGEARRKLVDIASIDEVRGAGRPLIGFTLVMAERERALKAFLYRHLYHHPNQKEAADRARQVVSRLFARFAEDSAALPESWRVSLPADEPARSRHLADFVAGMTDRFAIDQHESLFGERPEGLSNV